MRVAHVLFKLINREACAYLFFKLNKMAPLFAAASIINFFCQSRRGGSLLLKRYIEFYFTVQVRLSELERTETT